ncbi:DNA polymerase III subunit alpha [Aquibacillus koreensis]|uniref:DNA polymerase III subunit alpha n=1 Tax=Aquibacillus koreensis TaxID=279446 RepID=A0A9X3WIK6_9BACI|nr:DNA polymerase III subunit alpha [Aquibacillus koreensis]MCT2537175.1 DNA polymerase III subunit alpha [Aquibacillus koreensis]MDC3419253.1 DNA polymerase III subunit alpha [Aquibacillus koreensis]
MTYAHLQVRSGFSIMQSTIQIERLVKSAKELGFRSIALTDENVMYGAISFYEACYKAGIKPIIGMTIDVEVVSGEMHTCIVLAKNIDGYRDLLQLSSHIQLQEQKRMHQNDLEFYTSNLVVILPMRTHLLDLLSNDRDQEANAYIEDWKKVVQVDSFYLGIDQNQLSMQSRIEAFCMNQGLQGVAISDVRFLHEADLAAFTCLQAINEGRKWSQDEESGVSSNHLYSKQELQTRFGSWPSLLQKTSDIVEQCNVKLELHTQMLPKYQVPENETSATYLRKLCMESLPAKYKQMTPEINNRLDYELKVLQEMQFSDYFLIVWDFIRFARKEGIMVGPGRGSAAGSLVAYLLDITNVDPIQYKLLFERFLNPERVTMPDIDIDFSDARRDEVIAYVRNKYGIDHVAQIITFGTFATRSVLRELFKVMDIDDQDASFILKEIPAQGSGSVVTSVKASKELTEYVKQSEKLQMLFKIATKLEGLPRHISTHAAGVVISEQPLVEHVPLTTSHGGYLTQYAMKELETIGLLKIDFLGLRNLTLLERIVATIERKEKKVIDLDAIPLQDPRTFSLLQKGKTNGVFQLESQGMKNVLKKLMPNHFEDVVAVNALYRPGPMEYIPVYIKRKHKEEPVSYPHGDLQPILKQTYGVLVYQEQIMQIANKVAGFTLGQADLLRRAISKKQKAVMEEEREHFISGCMKNGYQRKVAEELFEWIVRFSNYGFNRSHAVAYSMISYQLAYLKAHYPTHFLAEILSSISGQHDKIRAYLKEANELQINILPPSINKSFGKFTVEKNAIRMGLLSIKGIGHQVIKEIIQVRKDGPFKHLFDFCLRVPLNIINRQIIEVLILVGAFDDTNPNRASLLASLDSAMEQGELFKEFDDQPSFFQKDIELDVSYNETDPFPQMKQLTLEKELLGMYVSSHPLAEHRKTLRENGYLSLMEIQKHVGKQNMLTSGVVQEIKTIRTKRGEGMAFVSFSDETDEMDAVLFPDVFRQVKPWMKDGMLVCMKGKVEVRNNRTQLLIAELTPFQDANLENKVETRIFIKLTEENSKMGLQQIRQVAEENPGTVPIIVYDEHTKKTYQLASDYYIHRSKTAITALENIFGSKQVVLKNVTDHKHG